MGKNQKIPYINEVLIYFMKAIVIFIILYYLLYKINLNNWSLALILSIFAAFSFNLFYLSMISLNYALSFFIFSFKIGELAALFLYLFSVLLNTFIMIIFLRMKYKLKENI